MFFHCDRMGKQIQTDRVGVRVIVFFSPPCRLAEFAGTKLYSNVADSPTPILHPRTSGESVSPIPSADCIGARGPTSCRNRNGEKFIYSRPAGHLCSPAAGHPLATPPRHRRRRPTPSELCQRSAGSRMRLQTRDDFVFIGHVHGTDGTGIIRIRCIICIVRWGGGSVLGPLP